MAVLTKITRPALPPVGENRPYPHVAQVGDHAAKQSLQLTWEQVHALTDRLAAAEAAASALAARVSALEARIGKAESVAQDAMVLSVTPTV